MKDQPSTVERLPVPLYRVLNKELETLLPGIWGSDRVAEAAWEFMEEHILDGARLEEAWRWLNLDELHAAVVAERQPQQEVGKTRGQAGDSTPSEPGRAGEPVVAQAHAPENGSPASRNAKRLKQLNDLIHARRCLYEYKEFHKEKISKPARELAEAISRSEISARKLVMSGRVSIGQILASTGQSVRDLAAAKKLSLRKAMQSAGQSIRERATTPQEERQWKEDLGHVNRLLLEELFPDQIRKIHEVRLEETHAEIHSLKPPLSAVCLSGGGIRSATFALGILQGLARKGLLGQFHYLSTVSGGGYIGSWLSAWYHHRDNDTQKVNQELECGHARSPTRPEPGQIQHLRAYSNYLAPRLGLLSADTWVLVATYFRNLFLNWLVFIPILLAVCALPRLSVSMVHFRSNAGIMDVLMNGALWGGLLAAAWAVGYATAALNGAIQPLKPDATLPETRARESVRCDGQGNIIRWFLIPLCLSATLLTTFWLWYYRPSQHAPYVYNSFLIHWPTDTGPNWRNYLALGIAVHGLGWLFGWSWVARKSGTLRPRHWPILEVGAGAVGGLLLWLVARLAYVCFPAGQEPSVFYLLYTCLASPLYLIMFLLAVALFSGLCSNRRSDEDREWTARAGAWVLIALTVWAVFSAWILFGPLLFYKAAALTGSVGGVSGLVTLLLGHSGKTAANPKTQGASGKTAEISNWILAGAAPVFLAAILACLSLLTSGLLYLTVVRKGDLWWVLRTLIRRTDFGGISPWDEGGYLEIIANTPWRLELAFTLVMLLVGLIASWLINLNKFSLHAVYRNRLVRAYLGASNARRKPNLFTGFDPDDNIPLKDLRSPPHAGPADATQRPLHLLNLALNLVGGKNLAWQQRKAATFTASKLYTGNYLLGYRPTALYARKGYRGGGLTLGTAITISGAAANSNMGYHSSPLVCFLMTLFNVRLGCWLGNPGAAGQDSFEESAPKNPAYYAAKEAFGLTDDTNRFVFLSDGGHFENLGLYEMVLRRCKLIVVCDAGCDPNCALEDLGNAIRKIRADLGVNIDIKQFEIYSRNNYRYEKPEHEEIGKYCAVGEIDYGTADKASAGGPPIEKGTLIYLKPALCGPEPKDVFNYTEKSPSFPHESTGDQFFSESQFESYRALGLRVIERIYQDDQKFPGTLDGFRKQASHYAQEPPANAKP